MRLKIWRWWQRSVKGIQWVEYTCGCQAVQMFPKCPMCNTAVWEFHKEKHEITIQMENWENV